MTHGAACRRCTKNKEMMTIKKKKAHNAELREEGGA